MFNYKYDKGKTLNYMHLYNTRSCFVIIFYVRILFTQNFTLAF